MTKADFLQVLDDLRATIELDDSFGGTLEYALRKDGDLNIRMFVRIGNKQGQGGAFEVVDWDNQAAIIPWQE